MKIIVPLLLAACASVATSVHGQAILSPTGILSNALGDFDGTGTYGIQHTIDGSGLSTGFVSGVTNFNTYLALNPSHSFVAANNEWFAPNGVFTGSIVFDLGAVYSVGRMALWNEDLYGLTTLAFAGSTQADFSSNVFSLGGFTIVDNPLGVDYFAQVLNFTQSANVRYINMLIRSAGPGIGQAAGPGTGSASLGEVAFAVGPPGGIAAVPEPSTYGAIGALGLLAIGAWRKRKNV